MKKVVVLFAVAAALAAQTDKNGSVAELFQNVLGEDLVYFLVPGNGLGDVRPWVGVPIMLPTVTNQQTPDGFEFPDQVGLLHPIVSSDTLRMPGSSPLVRSR